MMKNICLFERVSKIGFGFFFLLAAFGCMLSGITVLPIVGFIFAVPLLMLSFYFFRAHLKKDCQIQEAPK